MSKADLKIETGIQLLTRLTKKPSTEGLYLPLFENGPKGGDFIEIISESCTSHLLIDIITEALIQPHLKNEMAMGILLCNTDGHICMESLINVLKNKISKAAICSEIEFDSILTETLSNLFVLDIYDATQFYTTIHNMETLLSQHPHITLIIFDTLTAFYWSEQGYKITKMDLYVKNLINIIQNVTKEYKTVCIYTKPEYFTSINSDTIEIDYQIHLLDHCKGNYQVNIKSSISKTTKFYNIKDKQIKWL